LLCALCNPILFFPPSHEFFYNVSFFLISSIGFLDVHVICWLVQNSLVENNKKCIQNNPLNKKEGHNYRFLSQKIQYIVLNPSLYWCYSICFNRLILLHSVSFLAAQLTPQRLLVFVHTQIIHWCKLNGKIVS
jgi:hypothetical protein